MTPDLQKTPLTELWQQLNTTPKGLSQAEAAKRLQQYGLNQLEEKQVNPLLQFLKYFWGPIPWMIEIALVLSAVARHWPDFVVILILLLSNAVVGFWEEHSAQNAVDALKEKLAATANVLRDGIWATLVAKQLVPGDIVRLRFGDIAPADVRLIDGDGLDIDQSALTGESLPVHKVAGDAVFSGSIIRKGECNAVVYATGANTYFGKTAKLVEDAQTVSHFQQAVLKIGNYLIILAIILVALIIATSLIRGDDLVDTLQFALVLMVAAIPVAMPTVLSVTMAVGSRLLAKQQAIVTKLEAIEELAGVDILCSDKTGTLTFNKLALGQPYLAQNFTAKQIILDASLASKKEDNDTIDLAVMAGLDSPDELTAYKVTDFVPFDPVNKRTEATVTGPEGKVFKVAKGAPQVIIGMSNLSAAELTAAQNAVDDFANKGFRALGVAIDVQNNNQWQLVGILSLSDPPRSDAKTTIATAERMGIEVKMVTGDAIAIAKETASLLGMGTSILDATTLVNNGENPTPAEVKSIEQANGFAEVFPEQKYNIVTALQADKHIVAMTGDGVNDAPALKKANCGIAVSGATDAARAAADIVLLTPGLSVIIEAIKESRRIFQRMNSYTIYRIAETLRVLFFMTLSIIVFNFYPVTAIMIVMLALLNDGAIISIAYDNVTYRNKPEAWNMKRVLSIASILGVVGVIFTFGLFYLAETKFHLEKDVIQTLMYLKLSVAGHLTIFLTRTRGPFWSSKPSKVLFLAVMCTQALATCIAVYGIFMTPLGWKWAGIVWGYAICSFLIADQIKLLAYKLIDPLPAKSKN